MRIEYHICDNCGQKIDSEEPWRDENLELCSKKCRDAVQEKCD